MTTLSTIINEIEEMEKEFDLSNSKVDVEKEKKKIKKSLIKLERNFKIEENDKMEIIYESLININEMIDRNSNTLLDIFYRTVDNELINNKEYKQIYLKKVKDTIDETINEKLLRETSEYFNIFLQCLIHPKDKMKHLFIEEKYKKHYKILTIEELELLKTRIKKLTHSYIDLSIEIYNSDMAEPEELLEKFSKEIKYLYKQTLSFMYYYDPINFEVHDIIKSKYIDIVYENQKENEEEKVKINKWLNTNKECGHFLKLESYLHDFIFLNNYFFYEHSELKESVEILEKRMIKQFEKEKKKYSTTENKINNSLKEIKKKSKKILTIKQNLLKES